MNALDIFYNAWVRNHAADNRMLIKYYAKYERYAYLSPKDSAEVFKIQNKYGEHILSLIIPHIKEKAHKININGTYEK